MGDDRVITTLIKEHLESHGIPGSRTIPPEWWAVENPQDARYQIARIIDRYTSEAAPVGVNL